jgi:hypothetical protein
MTARVEELLARSPPPSAEELNNAFWQASAGGHRRTAECLHAQGAGLNWIPHYAKRSPLAVVGALSTVREALATWLRDQDAASITQPA